MLKPAQKGKYAVGLFNAVNLELARGIIAAAEQTGSPVIMGTAEVLFPYGPLEEVSYYLLPMAKKAKIAHITTLAGYVHFMLTGVNAVGIGEASGIFPIDSNALDYDKEMLQKFDELTASCNLPWKLTNVLPQVLVAGEQAGTLTEAGGKMIDDLLPAGIPFAPAEGDAGTGMTATNAVAPRTGNVSAGTSIFSMVVLEEMLESVYEEIDMVTTPSGKPVAMVHCNNCTNDSNAWISMLSEATELFGTRNGCKSG